MPICGRGRWPPSIAKLMAWHKAERHLPARYAAAKMPIEPGFRDLDSGFTSACGFLMQYVCKKAGLVPLLAVSSNSWQRFQRHARLRSRSLNGNAGGQLLRQGRGACLPVALTGFRWRLIEPMGSQVVDTKRGALAPLVLSGILGQLKVGRFPLRLA